MAFGHAHHQRWPRLTAWAETTGPARTLTPRMCGRYTHTTRRSDEIHAKLARAVGVESPPSERGFERFNIAPTQEVLAVVEDPQGRRIEELRWGLSPHWAKDVNTRFSMINARAETVHEKPAYRGLARQAGHRCLILADGYYEWQRPEDPKQPRRPVHFSLGGEEPFCFAGLWTRWTPPGGKVVSSCAIVTCAPNALTRPIHHRMPVILADPEAWQCWLDPAVDREATRELLGRLPSERMVARPANPVLNSPRHEGPDCLAAHGRFAGAPSPRALERPARLLDPGCHRSGVVAAPPPSPPCFTMSPPAISVGSLPGPTFEGGPGVTRVMALWKVSIGYEGYGYEWLVRADGPEEAKDAVLAYDDMHDRDGLLCEPVPVEGPTEVVIEASP